MIPPSRPLLLSLLALGALTPAALAQGESRPAYQLLRQNEDWSFLADPSKRTERFDDLKYMALSEDGERWVSFGGSTRLRYEAWKNFNFGAPAGVSHSDTFGLFRARTHADLHWNDQLRFFGELKSALVTDRDLPGGRRGLDRDTFDIQQLFVDWTFENSGERTARLRAGRQMLSLGAQRLVSPLPWGNALRAWDGLALDLDCQSWHVTTLLTAFVPVDQTNLNEADRDELLYGIYSTKTIAPMNGLDLFWLGSERPSRGFNGTMGDVSRQTLGFRRWAPVGDNGDAEVEAAYQFGEVGTSNISAWSFASQAGYRPGGGKARYWLGLDVASGDDDPGGTVETFDPLYPLGHAYFGFIDAVGRQNAVDAHLGGNWPVAKDVTFRLAGHSLWLESKDDALYNAGGGVSRAPGAFQSSFIGWEIDATATWKADAHTTAQLGASRLFAGSALEDSGPSQDIQFLYVQVSYNL